MENDAQQSAVSLHRAIESVSARIIGNQDVIRKLVIALLAKGHVLIEGVPGIAKTKLAVELAQVFAIKVARVQCTPDLLPSDITGMTIFRPDTGQFELHEGPVFTNILIADEVNRTPPKVQAALLEAMAEKQVSLFGTTRKLKAPFFVVATQNPIEQEGTYPLPEAQLDRFMFKLMMNTLGVEEEKRIITQTFSFEEKNEKIPSTPSTVGHEELVSMIERVSSVYVDPSIVEYVAELVVSTRDEKKKKALGIFPYIRLGASPRASLGLIEGAKANAMLEGRAFVTPQDIKLLAHDILRHRIILNFDAEARGMDAVKVIDLLLSKIPSP